jgi:uncharacterized protein (TIGR02145 family)
LAVKGTVITGCDPLPSTPLITKDNVKFINDSTYTNADTYNSHPITLSAPVKIVGKGSKTSLSTSISSVDYRDHQQNSSGVNGNDTDDYGSWFTWRMVAQYADVLCSNGWRVPSLRDFQDYSGIESGITNSIYGGTHEAPCIHGCLLGGYSEGGSHTENQRTYGYYWSSTEYSPDIAYFAYVTSSSFSVQGYVYRNYGLSLRCVKTAP